MENTEQLNSDVQVEASSEPQSQAAEAPEAQASGQEQQQSQDNTPFHEHPRFKELIEEKNSYKEQLSRMQEQIERLSQAQSQPKSQDAQKDALLERLKGIDPEFGSLIETFKKNAEKLEQLEQWKQQSETQTLQQQAVSTVTRLHEENKVPAEIRSFYDAMIRQEAASNPKLGLKDLPQVYKTVHERFTKYLDSTKRAERASYVQEKGADSKAPVSQPKGKTVTPQVRKQFSKDSGEERQETVSEVLKLMRAERNLDS